MSLEYNDGRFQRQDCTRKCLIRIISNVVLYLVKTFVLAKSTILVLRLSRFGSLILLEIVPGGKGFLDRSCLVW